MTLIFGHALLMKIVLSVAIFLTSFMLPKGRKFLCMVLVGIAFLVLVNLLCLSFSNVLMELVKFKPLVCILFLPYQLLELKCLPLGLCAFISFAAGQLHNCSILVATGHFSRLLGAVRVEICLFTVFPTEIIFLFKFFINFFFFVLFFFAQGDIVFAQTNSTLRNPERRRLASSLPTRALQSKAPRTTRSVF